MRDDKERLRDILESIENIERRMPSSRDAFMNDELIHVWMIHHITVIGEAAAGVSDDLKTRFHEVPWADVVAMRNVLVHQYFGVDPNVVWSTVDKDVPRLKSEMEKILAALQDAKT